MDADFQRLIFMCPQCGAKCQFHIIWHAGGGAVIQRIQGQVTRYVLQCTACQEFLFVRTRTVLEGFPSSSTITDMFPPVGMTPHHSLPAQVAVDIREASLCLSSCAWNAAAAMCRRALQSCAKNRGADPKDDLFDQLQELRDKSVIPPLIYDMADAIRKKGNIGAHPGRDPVVDTNVSERDARATFGIVVQVFKYVYEFPDEVAALRGS